MTAKKSSNGNTFSAERLDSIRKVARETVARETGTQRTKPETPPTVPETKTGLRYNYGKPKLSLVLEAPNALIAATRVLESGCVKYSRRNWKKGFLFTEIIDAMMRHTLAFMNGENTDEEGLRHIDCMLVNALFLSELSLTKPYFDDRKFIGRDSDGKMLSIEELKEPYDLFNGESTNGE